MLRKFEHIHSKNVLLKMNLVLYYNNVCLFEHELTDPNFKYV
jgi:hypothetical protein